MEDHPLQEFGIGPEPAFPEQAVFFEKAPCEHRSNQAQNRLVKVFV